MKYFLLILMFAACNTRSNDEANYWHHKYDSIRKIIDTGKLTFSNVESESLDNLGEMMRPARIKITGNVNFTNTNSSPDHKVYAIDGTAGHMQVAYGKHMEEDN